MESPNLNLSDLRIERSDPPGFRFRFWLMTGSILGLALLAGVAWWLMRPKTIEVRTVPARNALASAESTSLNASGYAIARRAATVSSKITGKVIEVLMEEGMRVREGQRLARLDDANVRAGLSLAEAQLQSARTTLRETQVRIREAQQELGRQTELLKNRVVSQGDYERAQTAVLALEARLEQQQSEVKVAERQVASWEQQLEDMVIRAPFGGIVTSKDAQPGETISPVSAGGGFTRTGICTLVDMESLEIAIDVNESYLHRVKPAQPVEATLDAYPDLTIPCHVIAIIPSADRQKSTVRVRVGFNVLEKRILPQMGVKVAFRATDPELAGGRTVLVPRSAVRRQDGRDVVLVMREGRTERRNVNVISTDSDQARIGAGIVEGEKVVVDWPKGWTDGQPVKEVRQPPDPPE